MDEPNRHRIEKVQLLPTGLTCGDQTGFFENRQMFHHPEARHFQPGVELFERAAVTLEEPIEEEATGRVGQRLENQVVIHHIGIIGDYMVTCQVPGNLVLGS